MYMYVSYASVIPTSDEYKKIEILKLRGEELAIDVGCLIILELKVVKAGRASSKREIALPAENKSL